MAGSTRVGVGVGVAGAGAGAIAILTSIFADSPAALVATTSKAKDPD